MRSKVVRWALVLTIMIGSLVGLESQGFAAVQNLPPWYSHSWYVTSIDLGRISTLGGSDGVWDTQHCYAANTDNGSYDKAIVLDFGRPIRQSTDTSTYFQGYGTVLKDSGAIVNDDQIVQAAEFFISNWYQASNSCPRLTLGLGTNNSYLCENSPAPCDPAQAGAAWAASVDRLAAWVAAAGMQWQVNVVAADDIEGDGYPPWSCATTTRAFVDGYASGSQTHTRLYDFGDPFTSSNCFTLQDLYYVAWGAPLDYSLPEVYSGCFLGHWTDGSACSPGLEATYGKIAYSGAMTQCAGPDQLPDANCLSAENYVTWSWKQAWNGLWSIQAGTYGFTTLPWVTNIKNET